MSTTLSAPPIGQLLEQAALVSSPQIELALRDQKERKDLRLGEILALRGLIRQKTADFFVEQWPHLLQKKRKAPIGYYLQEAALLSAEQTRKILSIQRQTGLRFGALAVREGWIKQKTLDFFLDSLEKNQPAVSHNLSKTIQKVLSSRKISRHEQMLFIRATSQETLLSDFELNGIQQICDRLSRGELEVIDD